MATLVKMDPWARKTDGIVMGSNSLSEIIEKMYVPAWKKQRFSTNQIEDKKRSVIVFAQENPKASRKEVYAFMKTI